MSVSPTRDALIVALDFEGEFECTTPSKLTIVQNSTRDRRPQSRAFSTGGYASRAFQHCHFESRA